MTSNVSKRDTQSLHFAIRSGLAGGIAGCVAKTVVAPLDRVKILFQASNPDFQKYTGSWSGVFRAVNEIYHDGGVRGLLQGHSATLLRVFPYAAIKFMTYDQIRYILMPTREQETHLRRFTAGALSGVTSVFCVYPLDIIRIRMAFQTKSTSKQYYSSPRPSFLRAARQIYTETAAPTTPLSSQSLLRRFPALKYYRGFTVTVAGMIPYAGVSFWCWDGLRAHFLPTDKAGNIKPNPMGDLVIGAISGAVGQTASYPFEVVRRRMQVGGLTHPDRWLRFGETVEAIWQSRGWRGFFVGLSVGYLKIIPMTAVSYTVWQGGKRILGV